MGTSSETKTAMAGDTKTGMAGPVPSLLAPASTGLHDGSSRVPSAVLRRLTQPAAPLGSSDILALHPAIGNRAVQRLIASRSALAADDYGPRDGNGVAASANVAVDRAESSSSTSLPSDMRHRFEGALGTDLSSVRLHTGSESAEAAHAVGAKAYTVGQDIHFGQGHFAPSDPAGAHLLAHEVAHTVQNQAVGVQRSSTLAVSSPTDAAEVEAEHVADALSSSSSSAVHPGHGSAPAARMALSATPAPLARAEWKTNGGTFKIDNYSETDADRGKDTDKHVGAAIEITFTPAESVSSDKISFVQIMKTVDDGTPYLFENEKPRATDAKSGDAGWALDRLQGRKSANYGQNNDGSAAGNTRFGHRKSKTDVADAWMSDGINLPRRAGKSFGSNATSFALDNTHNKYLGGVTWGFTTDAAGKTVKKPEAIQSMGDPGGVQKNALEKWNEQAALTDTSKRNAPDQEKVPVP